MGPVKKKIKIQVSKFEDQLGFIGQLLNWAASLLESKKELAEAVEHGRLLQAEEGAKRKFQEWIALGKVTSLWGKGWGLSRR